MALYSKESIVAEECAWYAVSRGASVPVDKLLLAENIELGQRIIWLERLRKYALSQGDDLSSLNKFDDFHELVGDRRPDPTLDQWLWLYTQVGARRWSQKTADAIGIMAGRDALLPFISSIPDKKLWEDYGNANSGKGDNPLKYQGMEDAIQADSPSKLTILKIMSRGISDDDILDRAIFLQKKAIIASMFKTTLPTEKKVDTLITAHTTWEDSTQLLQLLFEYEKEIAQWRDPWGNGFFWYLYRRPILQKEFIQSLPEKITDTFNVKNIFGFAPADLWIYYRPPSFNLV